MPPYLAPVDPWMGETAADNRYVTLVGTDTLPDMMLGRLSVNSVAEASAFVNKIVAYEQNPVPGDWQQQVLAVADNADGAGNFAYMSDNLLTCCLQAPYQAVKVYYGVTHLTKELARAAIQAGINSGKLIVNYIGHAATTLWAQEGLFIADDVSDLVNGAKLPVILAMTCREGYYISPDPLANGQEALGEVVTRTDGRGAVASWSPTGLGVVGGHDYLNRGFFKALFQNGAVTIGEATATGKLYLWGSGSSRELLDTYLLFGDPALRILLIPPVAPDNLQASAVSHNQIELTWQDKSSETEFQIERSPDGSTGWQQIAAVNTNVISYIDMNLTCETHFYYRVHAYHAGDSQFSGYSNIATATTYGCHLFFFPLTMGGAENSSH